MVTASAPPTPDGAAPDTVVRSGRAWGRFLVGFLVLWGVLQTVATLDPTARWGVLLLAAVLVAAVVVERVDHDVPAGVALRRLGLGRSRARVLGVAAAVSAAVLLVYPLTEAVTGATVTLRPGWPWLLLGVFALHGVAEEVVWRGYAFRRLRRDRSFAAAVAWTMPLLAATHLPILVTAGAAVGLGAMAVAAATSIPLAYLFETGRGTVWAPALVHTAIDSFKLVVVPAGAVATFSLLLVAVSLLVPLLALAVPRRVLEA
ncbi:CPBP family intramembrane glutamic endopeptidase [Actinomycetospora straminea]|uniref:CAAX prenyl protease 2/Lysostaphin resistance protein A-like domain-containing protein n=1 Tax=Actinomycetospora straminea TaxID=663607 RepID=A0ABP9EQ45_9PSEU|nr:CPBP family intramembrane glutamic endopeptidase [Actinomycetospora straminea]MDD7933430.1 CPBP family intramembrane metalloprotease [Actinomycetospora straminea]